MRIPIAAVREMKHRFHDHTHIARIARSAGHAMEDEDTRKMWSGDFDGVELKKAEVFFALIGYQFELTVLEK